MKQKRLVLILGYKNYNSTITTIRILLSRSPNPTTNTETTDLIFNFFFEFVFILLEQTTNRVCLGKYLIRQKESDWLEKFVKIQDLQFRNEAQGRHKVGAGGALAPPIFARSDNPISTRGDTLSPPSTTSPPGISDLATAL